MRSENKAVSTVLIDSIADDFDQLHDTEKIAFDVVKEALLTRRRRCAAFMRSSSSIVDK